MTARVFVTLKKAVLDPQGKAVQGALAKLGYPDARDVRVGRTIEITLEAKSKEEAAETPANLAVLHVTKPWRRHGVGCALTNEVVRLARAEGVQRLYVSATPTRGTLDFYLSQGFMPLATPDERLFALEPEDIHLQRPC